MSQTVNGYREGTADVLSSYDYNTALFGEGYYPLTGNAIRNIDTPDIITPNYCATTTNIPDYYYCGSALAGAFWDLRASLFDDPLVPNPGQVANRLFADFMLVTDAGWDSSFLVEVLAADDTNGTFSDLTPHWDHIVDAFQAHGFFPALCYGPHCGGVVVEWVGPLTPPSELDNDYSVNNSVVPPIVTLIRTEKGGVTVDEWRIGHASGQDIGAVIAEWIQSDPAHDVQAIAVGTLSNAPVRNVNVVDVLPQSTNNFTSVRLELTGDLGVRAQAYSASPTCLGGANNGQACETSLDCPDGTCRRRGGRISGTIAGNASFIVAESVGEGESSPSHLDVGGEIDDLEFTSVPSGATVQGELIKRQALIHENLDGSVLIESLRGLSALQPGIVRVDGELAGSLSIGEMAGFSQIEIIGPCSGSIEIDRMIASPIGTTPVVRANDVSGSIAVQDVTTPLRGTINVGSAGESANIVENGLINVTPRLGPNSSITVFGDVSGGGRIQLTGGMAAGSQVDLLGDLDGTLEILGSTNQFGGTVEIGTSTASAGVGNTGLITIEPPLAAANNLVVHGDVSDGGRVQLKTGIAGGASATIDGSVIGTVEVGSPTAFGGNI